MLTAITGVNWGDEGKGRMVDLLSQNYDIVVRYQGGNNAGHTVVNEKGRFILNLLPSGVLREGVVNVMGPGMVVDIAHLCKELQSLAAAGVALSPQRLKLSDRAVVCLPYHVQQDCLEEARLGDAKFGSTRRGIAPVYGDKYLKKAIRVGDLLDMQALKPRLAAIAQWKSLTFTGVYGAPPIDFDALWAWVQEYGEQVRPYICDVSEYLDAAAARGKNILFEAQLGALRDIDFGIYPYTSSSPTVSAYAPVGAGIPGRRLDQAIGVMKAYSTCVGEGPFTCEMFGDEAAALRDAGGEYGAATGRPRRVGGFDVVASRYGVKMQGCTSIALTKLDVLSYLDKIPVCVAYDIDGERVDRFPIGVKLAKAKPIYEYLPGFHCDISGCRTISDLPKEALDYVHYLEAAVGCRIKYVSVGPDRDAYIKMF